MDYPGGKTSPEKVTETSNQEPEELQSPNLMDFEEEGRLTNDNNLTSENGNNENTQPAEDPPTPNPETLKGILQSPIIASEDNETHKNNIETSEGQSPDSDESKKDDTNKAVTFAEDIEVYDCKAATPITVSLDTPVHLIDPIAEAEKAAQDSVDTSAIPSTTTEEGFVNAELVTPPESEEHKSDEEESKSIEKSAALRPSLLNLNKEPAILVSNIEDTKNDHQEIENTAKVESPSNTEEIEGEHRIFSVTVVDESELQLQEEKDEGNQDNDAGQSLLADGGDLLEKAPSTRSGQSQSSDSNVQDTIGPLENPAFLKTLQYSISQPFDEDEQYSVQSNLDLTSLMTGAALDPDMDGGWAWVVLSAAFVSLAILGATNLLAGVLMKAFLEEINPDLTKASWIGSVYVSVMCLCGPLVGMVMNRVGARLTMCLAGIVIFIGFMGASFSNSILQLILTHGIIAGIGSGFAINPVFVIVGQYFNRLRSLAFGLLATGAGVGFLAGGAIISQLLISFGLSGAYLLWSAIVLHITAMGLLMLPSPEERSRRADRSFSISHHKHITSQQEMTSGHNSIMSGLNSIYSGTDRNSVLSGLDRVGRSRLTALRRHSSKQIPGDLEVPLLKAVLHKEMSRSSHSVSTYRSHHRSQTQVFSPNPQRLVVSPDGGDLVGPPSPTSSVMTNTYSMNGTAKPVQSNHYITSSHSLANNFQSTSTLGPTTVIAPSSPTSTRAASSKYQRPRLLSTSSQPHSHYRSLSLISQGVSLRDGQTDLDNQSLASALVTTLRPRDALAPRYRLGSRSISTIMGSMASFPTALSVLTDDISRFDAFSTTGLEQKSLKDVAIGALDSLRLLRNTAFLVFLSTCLLWAVGEAPVMMYLPSFAISRGTSPMQASSLYTAMGCGSILGRFLTGLIASDGKIGPVLLHIGCLGVTGILVTLSPLITETVVQQMVFAGLLGVYTGSLVPLMTLITIDLLGITELSIGFGFICMAQGIGYLIGPPLSSVFVNSIGFAKAFVFSGCMLICASLLGLFLPLFIRREDDDDDQNSLDDLEKALNQISNTSSDDEDNNGCEQDDEELEDDNGTKYKLGLRELKEMETESNHVTPTMESQNQHAEDGAPRTFDQELEPIPEIA